MEILHFVGIILGGLLVILSAVVALILLGVMVYALVTYVIVPALRAMVGTLLYMIDPPWKGPKDSRRNRWIASIVGWVWTLPGMFFGAVLAPVFLQRWGLMNTFYQDPLIVGIAFVAGFAVQVFGWLLVAPALSIRDNMPEGWFYAFEAWLVIMVAYLIPLVCISYGAYRYLTWIGAGQGNVTTGFLGALVIKVIAIPFGKSIAGGFLIKYAKLFLSFIRKILRVGEDEDKH